MLFGAALTPRAKIAFLLSVAPRRLQFDGGSISMRVQRTAAIADRKPDTMWHRGYLMKLVRFNMDQSEKKVWVLQHDLRSIEHPPPKTRPIHLLTFVYEALSQDLPQIPNAKHQEMFRLCSALEAKLSAVKHFGKILPEAFLQIERPEVHQRDLAPFDRSLTFIALLEAYLNAIYSSLELTNHIVRVLDRNVKQGFHAMARKAPPSFDISRLPWLQSFYDIRTELCHYGSPLPAIQYEAIVVEITQKHKTHRYKQGTRVVVPISELFGYEDELFGMLDMWALDRLSEIGQNLTIRQLVFTRNERKGYDRTIGELATAHLDERVATTLVQRSTIVGGTR